MNGRHTGETNLCVSERDCDLTRFKQTHTVCVCAQLVKTPCLLSQAIFALGSALRISSQLAACKNHQTIPPPFLHRFICGSTPPISPRYCINRTQANGCRGLDEQAAARVVARGDVIRTHIHARRVRRAREDLGVYADDTAPVVFNRSVNALFPFVSFPFAMGLNADFATIFRKVYPWWLLWMQHSSVSCALLFCATDRLQPTDYCGRRWIPSFSPMIAARRWRWWRRW